MKGALVAYFSCIAATLNFEATTKNSNSSKKKPAGALHFVKIQVDVNEVNPCSGRETPPKKYTRTLPVPEGSSGEVKVGLKNFLGKFSHEPVVIRDTNAESPVISRKGRKVDSNIKTMCAKNKDVHAMMTAELVDKKGAPQSYRRYKRNIAARACYFVAATATSALLIPIGIVLTPLCVCCDWLEKREYSYYHDEDCCYYGSPSHNVWVCIMYPQRQLWSRVFTNKGSKRVVVVAN